MVIVKLLFYLVVGSWVVAFVSPEYTDGSRPTATVMRDRQEEPRDDVSPPYRAAKDAVVLDLPEIAVDVATKKSTIRLGNLASYGELMKVNKHALRNPTSSKASFLLKIEFGMHLTENVKKVMMKISSRTLRKYRKMFPGQTNVKVFSVRKNGGKRVLLDRGVGESKTRVKLDLTNPISQMIYDSPREYLNTSFLVKLSATGKMPHYRRKQVYHLKRKMASFIQLKNSPSMVIRTIGRVFRRPRSPQYHSHVLSEQALQSLQDEQETEEQEVNDEATTPGNSSVRSLPIPCKRPPVKTEEAFLSRVHRMRS